MAEGNEARRKFSLTIRSARNLTHVREIFETKAYAEVSIGSAKPATDADKKNGLNPVWNELVEFYVADWAVAKEGIPVVIKVYCKRTLGDRYIGEVCTTMKELFDQASVEVSSASLSLPIFNGTEKTSGILCFSYSFGEKFIEEKADWLGKLGFPVLAATLAGGIVEVVKPVLT